MGKRVLLALFIVAAMTGTARANEPECFTDFGHCMEAASTIDSFWYRWAAGLDCELKLINCARIAIMGA